MKVYTSQNDILEALGRGEITVPEAQAAFAKLKVVETIKVDGKGFIVITDLKSKIKVGEFARLLELKDDIVAVEAAHVANTIRMPKEGEKTVVADTDPKGTEPTTEPAPAAPETLLGVAVTALKEVSSKAA